MPEDGIRGLLAASDTSLAERIRRRRLLVRLEN
jgi:hypothetical protein